VPGHVGDLAEPPVLDQEIDQFTANVVVFDRFALARWGR
jgi:hypothetical protein